MNDLSALRARYLAIRTEIAGLRLDLAAFRDELVMHRNDEKDGFSVVLSDMIAGMERETDTLIAEARDILARLREGRE